MNEYAKIAQPIIQEAAFRPNLGMQLPQFGPQFEMGSRSGIQSALQPLRGFISNQIQQQTNEKISPFIEEVATNAQETFDIESGPQLGYIQPMPYHNADISMSLRNNGVLQAGGLESLFQGGQQNMNRPMPMAQGGSVPRQTMIEEQPHMLAYINPEEEMMLRRMGGTGQPGPGGVPAYPPQSVNERDQMDRMEAVRNNFMDQTNQENDNDDAERRARIKAQNDAIRARQAANVAVTRSQPNIEKPEPKSRAAQDAFIAAKQRSNFFQNNPEASGIENEGILTRGLKSSIPYQMFNNLFNNRGIMKDKLAQQGNYPIRGIGGLMDRFFNTTPVRYEPIFDKNNKLIGTVGINEKGTKTAIQGRAIGFDAFGKPVDFSGVNANTGESATDDPVVNTPVSPTAPVTCPDGYIFDSETNACVAVEETTEETTEEEPIVVDSNVSVPTEYPLFNQGGVASLNDVARNMSRGPRGIAGYQGFMR